MTLKLPLEYLLKSLHTSIRVLELETQTKYSHLTPPKLETWFTTEKITLLLNGNSKNLPSCFEKARENCGITGRIRLLPIPYSDGKTTTSIILKSSSP